MKINTVIRLYHKYYLNIHWKDWSWSWNSNTLATWWKNWLLGKDPDAGKHWRQEKGTTEDVMVGWRHRLDGHEFEQALGVGDGQGSLAWCSPWDHKELVTTEQLNWTDKYSRNTRKKATGNYHPYRGAQLYLTLCDCMSCSPPGSSVHGILQARILEWVAISFSWWSSQPGDWTGISWV